LAQRYSEKVIAKQLNSMSGKNIRQYT